VGLTDPKLGKQMDVDECIEVAEKGLDGKTQTGWPRCSICGHRHGPRSNGVGVNHACQDVCPDCDPGKPLSVQDVVRRKLGGKVPE
jgi:hypothetical protein